MTISTIPEPPRPPQVVRAHGLSRSRVRTQLRNGELAAVRRGAYLMEPPPEASWERRDQLELARCLAVAQQSRGSVVLSHRSAALWHGAWVSGAATSVDVYAGYHATTPATDVRRHETDHLPESDIAVVQGVRVTSPERTALDCARTLPPREALAVVDSLLRGVCRPARFEPIESRARADALRRHLTTRLQEFRGRRGVVQARAVVTFSEPLSESSGESHLRAIAVGYGLPRPIVQPEVATARGHYFPDLGWKHPDSGRLAAVAEYDGEIKYGGAAGAAALVEEKRREDALCAEGLAVLRFTKHDLREPRVAFDQLCHVIPAARQRLSPVPELLQHWDDP